jgi:hypothetical protein
MTIMLNPGTAGTQGRYADRPYRAHRTGFPSH